MPGPHVQVATFCEKVLIEQDGVLSVIRAIDRFILSGNVAAGAPAELPEGGILQTTLLIVLRAGDAQGRHPVVIRPQQPSGVYLPDQPFDATFGRDESGVNLILNMAVPIIEGLYWFEVLVNETLLTRVPLRIMYQRVPGSP
ncbi:MAG: DUF6941 family protein [Acidimicrobiales bacterium]